MTLINFVLSFLGVGIIGIALYWAFVNYRRAKQNQLLSNELDHLVSSTLDVLQGTKKTHSKKAASLSDLVGMKKQDASPDLNSSEMLSSVLTVIINKYGDLRLSLTDFVISNDEYVSVYVDTNSKELILSLNHSLTEDVEAPYPVSTFSDPDDNTFH
tara:strand:- start:1477 stop:1947 length:471 start_codon:yes stop_codon:yes gene_type:complete